MHYLVLFKEEYVIYAALTDHKYNIKGITSIPFLSVEVINDHIIRDNIVIIDCSEQSIQLPRYRKRTI
jgi:hypothetical protein